MSRPSRQHERLAEAAEMGRASDIRSALAQGVDPKADGSLALQMAAACGHVECVKLLIPSSNPKSLQSEALTLAAQNGNLECVRLLIPVSDPADGGSSALLAAVHRGHFACMALLIPASNPSDLGSALRVAARMGQTRCVQALLPLCDASAHGRGMDKLTAAEQARQNDHEDLARFIEAFAEAQALAKATPIAPSSGKTLAL